MAAVVAVAATTDSRVSFPPLFLPIFLHLFFSSYPSVFPSRLDSHLLSFFTFLGTPVYSSLDFYHIQSPYPLALLYGLYQRPVPRRYTSCFLFSMSCTSCRPGETWFPDATTCQHLHLTCWQYTVATTTHY